MDSTLHRDKLDHRVLFEKHLIRSMGKLSLDRTARNERIRTGKWVKHRMSEHSSKMCISMNPAKREFEHIKIGMFVKVTQFIPT